MPRSTMKIDNHDLFCLSILRLHCNLTDMALPGGEAVCLPATQRAIMKASCCQAAEPYTICSVF